MKVVHILSRLSRRAGGLFETVPGLTKAVSEASEIEVSAIGVEDQFFPEDRSRWSCRVIAVPAGKGLPAKLNYAPGMLKQVLATNASLALCHGLWTHHNWVALRWAQVTGRPYLVSPHGMVDQVDLKKSPMVKWLARKLFVNRLFRGAACIRAVSTSEAKSLRAFGVGAPICLIPNGIWLPKSAVSERPGWLARVPSGNRILFYLGRLNPKKGLPALLTAWSQLQNKSQSLCKRWHLVIGGWEQEGHLRELRRQAAELGVEGTIHFPGPLFGAEKHAAYCHADGFVIPSTSEGMPTVVLEAWGYRLPVLMTPECNLPQGFAQNAAIRIDTNPGSIAQGLEALFTMSDTQRKEIAQRGRELVETNFSWPEIARQILSVYNWILAGEPRPDCVHLN